MSRSSREDDYLTRAEFRAWHGFLQFANTVMPALDEALARAHGISVKEFDVLITLFNAPAGRLRMTRLGELVLLSPAGVTHLVTRLERDGLVHRTVDEEDRRGSFAALTAGGHRRLRESRPTHNEVVARPPDPPTDGQRAGDAGRTVGEGPHAVIGRTDAPGTPIGGSCGDFGPFPPAGEEAQPGRVMPDRVVG